MLNPELKYWDIKYYYAIHCTKMALRFKPHVSYNRFTVRLNSWMTIEDAINSPKSCADCKHHYHNESKEDFIRRHTVLNNEWIPVIAYKENRFNFKPKHTLRHRFIRLFKKHGSI